MREQPVRITFFGVRGSTPCPAPCNARYGGNTSAILVDAPDTPPILLDLGTGIREYGESVPRDLDFAGVALLTHLHWDHVQGLPFFGPVLRPGGHLDVYSPPIGDKSLAEAFDECMCPPFFPVSLADFHGEVRFHELAAEPLDIGGVRIRASIVPHTGPTAGFRLDHGGRSVAYVPDHQQPIDGGHEIARQVVELCRGADVLIHDAQYTDDEFAMRAHWGHSTFAYAVEVARAAEVGRLVLFHHDPAHDDDMIDCIASEAHRLARGAFDVIAATEGLKLEL